jgi:hypothetical protein
MESMSDQPLGETLRAIASREPAPGAGAAAAIALALGLACARKATGITLKHHPGQGRPDELDARLADLAEQAVPLADQDAQLFAASLAGDEGAARDLTAFGKRAIALASVAREQIARAAAAVHPMLRGDMIAAQALVDAAAIIFRANLIENEDSAD